MHRGEALVSRGIYLDYDFKTVTYRWDHRTALIYMRFCDTAGCLEPVAYHNRLFNDAPCFGRKISREEYERGSPFR